MKNTETEEVKPKKIGRPTKEMVAARKAAEQARGWGGVREGSGRKSVRSKGEKLSETIAFRVSAETKEKVRALKEKGVNIIPVLEDTINNLAKLMGI